jgi:tetratricopeptide (TPR) repeat protein
VRPTGPLVALWLLALPAVAEAAGCEDWVATVVSFEGAIEVRRVGQPQPAAPAFGDLLCPGDTVLVKRQSRAALRLRNDAVLRLDQNTTISLTVVREEEATTTEASVLRGIVHFISHIRERLKLKVVTPFVNGTVEGTEFVADVAEQQRDVLTVLEGSLFARTRDGKYEATATSGHSVTARPGQPLQMVPVTPRDAVQWALYYPSIVDYRATDFPGLAEDDVRRLVAAFRRGDVAVGLTLLDRARAGMTDSAYRTYRAALLLSVGRVDEARREIDGLPEADGRRKAVETIIAVVLGDKVLALTRGDEAVKALPDSPAAWIALSYAQQASFDLAAARRSLEEAVKVGPQDALARARLAEIWLSFGRVQEALREANEAVRLGPDLARTQTVLGFAYLAEFSAKRAQEAFERAIALDPADPMPRLGLGLARIRRGQLDDGVRDIETAASLDPGNSLVRSYLGKGYYEERRNKPAGEEYARAKALDPKDPTPWFYDAIEKQTSNRPVEALRDMQRAIELNDNRAVYRSNLELDSDLASRSSSLARIYTDLGFQQLGLVEGYKSVNTDPTNFSAHRFLADSYSVLPRHEIARVSELLQSQMLQPLNVTPLQTRLAEPNLLLIGAQGPTALGFNEFNPLFTSDGVTLQTGGFFGQHGTYAGEGILSGIYGKASFSLGGSYFETNGWRDNATQQDGVADAFFQLAATPQTNLQFEFRYRSTQEGDLQLNFFDDDFRPRFKQDTETGTYRVGLRHDFTPDSIVLASFIYQHRDATQTDSPNAILVGLSDRFPNQNAFSGELQHLFRSRPVSLTGGFGYSSINATHDLTLQVLPPFGGDLVTIDSTANENAGHLNAYLYSYINLLPRVTVTLGLSGDIFTTQSKDTESTSQVNPKFGITWTPVPSTTLRVAAFRVLKRILITDQTLEPTQVAGFNQFYDDVNATSSWNFGGAIDQKFMDVVFAGGEFATRRLSVPFRSVVLDDFGELVEDRVQRGNGQEYVGRAYLFATPCRWAALSAEFVWEQFNNDAEVAFFFKDVTTYKVPLTMRLFQPFLAGSGLNLMLRGMYVNQHGDFVRRGSSPGSSETGQSDFWVFDAGLSYRFPKRYGTASIGGTNLTNQRFRYQETDFRNASIVPTRGVFARLTFEF